MRRYKLNVYLIILLAMTSIISVGFASWTITDSTTASIEGYIVADDVINASDIIRTEITSFRYFNTFFIHEEEAVDEFGEKYMKVSPSDKGYMLITITVSDGEKLKKLKNPVLNLYFEQEQASIDSLVTNGISSNGYVTNITYNGISMPEEELRFNDHQIKISCAMSENISEYVFVIEFTVNDTNRTDFFEALLYSHVNFTTLVIIGGDTNDE